MSANLVATALRLITKHGKTITYTRVVTGAYDPTTSKAIVTTTLYTIKAIATDVSGSNLVNGTLVKRNDKSFLIAAGALPITPDANDIVNLDGFEYEVYTSNTTFVGEVAGIYTVKAKRA